MAENTDQERTEKPTTKKHRITDDWKDKVGYWETICDECWERIKEGE